MFTMLHKIQAAYPHYIVHSLYFFSRSNGPPGFGLHQLTYQVCKNLSGGRRRLGYQLYKNLSVG
jgi:hypothetical protein